MTAQSACKTRQRLVAESCVAQVAMSAWAHVSHTTRNVQMPVTQMREVSDAGQKVVVVHALHNLLASTACVGAGADGAQLQQTNRLEEMLAACEPKSGGAQENVVRGEHNSWAVQHLDSCFVCDGNLWFIWRLSQAQSDGPMQSR